MQPGVRVGHFHRDGGGGGGGGGCIGAGELPKVAGSLQLRAMQSLPGQIVSRRRPEAIAPSSCDTRLGGSAYLWRRRWTCSGVVANGVRASKVRPATQA